MAPSVKPEQDPGHVPTYAEWQAAQYGPHRFGQDPTAQMPMGRTPTYAEWQQMQQSPNPSALRFPALPTPKFVADQTKRLNPNAGAPDKSIPDQLGEHARHVAAGIDVLAGSTPGLPIEGYLGMKAAAAVTRQAVAPALENPAFTAATIGATAIPGVGPLVGAAFGVDMLHNVAKYGYQTVHEYMMTPEERAIAQQDPNRISTEAAVVQIGMLGLMGLGAGHAFSKITDVSQGMTEAGAAALRPYVQSPVGATQLGAAAAEFGLPSTASPYPPESPLSAAWRDGYSGKPVVRLPGTVEQIAPTVTQRPSLIAATRTTNGQIFEAPIHAIAHQMAADANVSLLHAEDGFTTPDGQFLSREDALRLAEAHDFPDVNVSAAKGSVSGILDAVDLPAGAKFGIHPSREVVRAEAQRLAAPPVAAESTVPPAAPTGPVGATTVAGDAAALGQRFGGERPPDHTALVEAFKEQLGRPLRSSETVNRAGDTYILHDKHEGALWDTAVPVEKLRAGLQEPKAMSGLTPIEGTGETRTRGLATSTVSRVAEDIKSLWSDLPEYQRISISEQAHRAQDLITADPVRAKSIAMGDEPAPIGLHAEAVFVALRNKARAEGDVGLIHDLATGGLTEQATTMGQKLRLLAENDPEDPVAKIRRISDKRSEGRGAAKVIKSETEVIQKHTELNLKSLMDFFESQKC